MKKIFYLFWQNSSVKTSGRFFQIFWPFQKSWTLSKKGHFEALSKNILRFEIRENMWWGRWILQIRCLTNFFSNFFSGLDYNLMLQTSRLPNLWLEKFGHHSWTSELKLMICYNTNRIKFHTRIFRKCIQSIESLLPIIIIQ